MAITTAAIERQLRLGEDSRWEFKQIEFRGDRTVSPRRDDLADELAAFANTSGGVMLCGVTDSGRVPGMSRPQLDAVERVIMDACSDSIEPPIDVDIRRMEVTGGQALAGGPGREGLRPAR